jgi:hypothetical protein
MFLLNAAEWELLKGQVLEGSKDVVLRSQIVTSKKSGDYKVSCQTTNIFILRSQFVISNISRDLKPPYLTFHLPATTVSRDARK